MVHRWVSTSLPPASSRMYSRPRLDQPSLMLHRVVSLWGWKAISIVNTTLGVFGSILAVEVLPPAWAAFAVLLLIVGVRQTWRLQRRAASAGRTVDASQRPPTPF
jgi:hypothetical protein